jgi:hypothetical protein
MKRFILLSFFGLCLMMTASYCDSGVEKALTYQVSDQGNDLDFVTSMDFEVAQFNLNSPDLGRALPVNTFLVVKPKEGYFTEARAPPDARC